MPSSEAVPLGLGACRRSGALAGMLALVARVLEWLRSLFWKEEMELTLVGLQYSGKTTLLTVLAVRSPPPPGRGRGWGAGKGWGGRALRAAAGGGGLRQLPEGRSGRRSGRTAGLGRPLRSAFPSNKCGLRLRGGAVCCHEIPAAVRGTAGRVGPSGAVRLPQPRAFMPGSDGGGILHRRGRRCLACRDHTT